MQKLLLKWLALWERIGVKGSPYRQYSNLYVLYGQQHRRYHNLEHIERCIKELDEVRAAISDQNTVELALWYHDAIYKPGAKDNEEKSVLFFESQVRILAFDYKLITKVSACILATKHCGKVPDDVATAFVLDIDLSSFGQPYEIFMQDSQNIREEYRGVRPSDKDFNESRIKALNSFLARPSIYFTIYFQEKYESRARANIQRAINELI